jgi:uncharacterized ferritin-like protein (DUF455 family)
MATELLAPSATSDASPKPGDHVITVALKVLQEADPLRKALYTNEAGRLWRANELGWQPSEAPAVRAPSRPARDDSLVRILPPNQMPGRGKAGSLISRQMLVHSMCHIESWAVDLSWDIIARFGADPRYASLLPKAFYDDFVQVVPFC